MDKIAFNRAVKEAAIFGCVVATSLNVLLSPSLSSVGFELLSIYVMFDDITKER
jgi:hypothetical protein